MSDVRLGRLLRQFSEAVATLAYAAAVVALPIVAHAVHPVLGFLCVAIVASGTALFRPTYSVVVILFSFMFQNLIVASLVGQVRSDDDFDMIRAYNFFTVCATWLTIAVVTLVRFRSLPPTLVGFLKWTTGALVLIGLYFLLGFALYGMAAIVNLRNVAMPLLLFQVCIVIFTLNQARIGGALTGLAFLLMFCGFTEFFYRDAWLNMTNFVAYWEKSGAANWLSLALDKEAKESGLVATGLTDTFRISFFNSPMLDDLGIQVMRLFGPNMHAISFAYCVCFFCIFALFRGKFVQAAFLCCLLVLCSVKGALITLLMVCASWVVFFLVGARLAFAFQVLAALAFAVMGIYVGLNIGDFHVLGLMSGLREFVTNPIGRGIGAGGNLSPLFVTINWQEAQAAGHTPFPVESSVGVLLYQMGFCAIAVIATYVWIAWRLLKLSEVTGHALHAALSFAVIWITTNGLFQEEAYFSPLALAAMLSLCGMVLGAGIRTGAIQVKRKAGPNIERV